jgi:hypothetical protein
MFSSVGLITVLWLWWLRTATEVLADGQHCNQARLAIEGDRYKAIFCDTPLRLTYELPIKPNAVNVAGVEVYLDMTLRQKAPPQVDWTLFAHDFNNPTLPLHTVSAGRTTLGLEFAGGKPHYGDQGKTDFQCPETWIDIWFYQTQISYSWEPANTHIKIPVMYSYTLFQCGPFGWFRCGDSYVGLCLSKASIQQWYSDQLITDVKPKLKDACCL